jgi:hypothetical protein
MRLRETARASTCPSRPQTMLTVLTQTPSPFGSLSGFIIILLQCVSASPGRKVRPPHHQKSSQLIFDAKVIHSREFALINQRRAAQHVEDGQLRLIEKTSVKGKKCAVSSAR